jgi:hypothetical protein
MSSTLSNAVLRKSGKNATSKLLGPTRSMATGKEIRFGVEGRAAMLRGVDLMADAVQVRGVMHAVEDENLVLSNVYRWGT